MFQQFMEERLEKIKSGNCESDEFELESLAWRSSRANGRNGLRVLGGFGKNQNRYAFRTTKYLSTYFRTSLGF